MHITQFTLLATIAQAAPISINRLADLMVMDRTTLTRNLCPLSKQGWARIGTSEDHRMRVVTLTEEGQQVLAQALDRLRPQHVETRLSELSGAIAVSHPGFLFCLLGVTTLIMGDIYECPSCISP